MILFAHLLRYVTQVVIPVLPDVLMLRDKPLLQ
jgi:hypothetical protein